MNWTIEWGQGRIRVLAPNGTEFPLLPAAFLLAMAGIGLLSIVVFFLG